LFYLLQTPACDEDDISINQVRIFYGTQTGTCQKYSQHLQNTFAAKEIKCVLTDLASFDPDETFLNFTVIITIYTMVAYLLYNHSIVYLRSFKIQFRFYELLLLIDASCQPQYRIANSYWYCYQILI